jgi:signal transduction histidine kinase
MVTVRNWPIRVKIAVLVVVPLLAVGGLLAIIVTGALGDAQTGRDVRDFSRFTLLAGDTIDGLQRERVLTAAAVSAAQRGDTGPLSDARQRVDTALSAFTTAARTLGPADRDPSVRSHLDAVTGALVGLRDLRAGVDAETIRADRAEQFYSGAIAALFGLNSDLDNYASGPDVGARADALVALNTAKEAFALEGAFIAGRLAAQRYQPGDYRRIIQLVGGQETRQQVFQEAAGLGEDKLYAGTVSGAKANKAISLQEQLLAIGDSNGKLPVDATAWSGAVADRLDRIRATEKQLTEGLITASVNEAASASGTVLSTILASLAVLVLSIVLSLLIARSLVRPLRLMRSAALDTAERGLVDMVSKLQAGEPVEPEAAPIPVLSTDEVGQVAVAFNSVHGVAVRMAMEQAATRKSTSDTFLNIARRSQALIHRQLQLIDDMERGTTEPLELAELFRLDHLATRMRRHAEDLIVLSGSTPARGWSRPVGLRDVVRGAMAEVEDYTRIAMRTLDEAEVIGPAVGDVIHLFAELLENATSFSPPTTWVYVHGQLVANGYVVEIDDAGLGMDEQRRAALNARLNEPGPFDLQGTERLGLFVVGRLARRHGIDVHLRRSPYGGTTAIVLLPTSLLQGRAPAASLARTGAGSHTPPPGAETLWRGTPAPPGLPPGLPAGLPAGRPTAPAGGTATALDRPPAATAPAAAAPKATALGPAPAQPRPLGRAGQPDWFADDLPVSRGPASAAQPAPAAPTGPPPPTPITPAVRVATLLARSNRAEPPPAPRTAEPPVPAGPPAGPAHGGPILPPAGPPAVDPRGGQQPPAGPAPVAPVGITENGLPRRSRQAPFGAGQVAAGGPRHRPADQLSQRPPEEVRAMMSSYQKGSDRGRQIAADPTLGAAAGPGGPGGASDPGQPGRGPATGHHDRADGPGGPRGEER